MGSPDPVMGWLGAKYPVVTDATNMPSAPAVDSPNKTIDKVVKDYFFKLEKGKGKTVIVNCYSSITAGQTVSLLNTIDVNAKSLLSGYEAGWGKLFLTEVQK